MQNNLVANIREQIYIIRGVEVMLDSDLAGIYEVETKRINEAVRRNPDKFPDVLMFVLSDEEWQNLRSQNATLKEISGTGQHRKYTPKVFTD